MLASSPVNTSTPVLWNAVLPIGPNILKESLTPNSLRIGSLRFHGRVEIMVACKHNARSLNFQEISIITKNS